MNFVPSQLLTDLSCASCRKYLSCFPIYSHPEQGSICGRCPVPSKAGFIRNGLYETLARTLKFPCCYYSEGCTEDFRPEDIAQHEKSCSFLKYNCPMANCTKCPWRGLLQNLLEHAEENHPTFVLKDRRFEIDFVHKYNENYVLECESELFIVNRKADPSNNVSSCAVSYIGNNINPEKYLYEITLENGSKTQSYKIRNNMATTTDMKGADVREILKDPLSIIATIDIIPSEEISVDCALVKEELYYESLPVNILRELECSICLEYMLTPIHQCITGHSFCEECIVQVKECPMCKQEFGSTRNIALANIINEMVLPCKYQTCKFTATGKQIKEHQTFCIHRPRACPLSEIEPCDVEITYCEIYDHILNKHYEHLLEMDVVTVPFDKQSIYEYYDCHIMRHDFKLFKMHYMYRDYTFQWAVQLIGPLEECSKYKFDIDIVDNGNNDNRLYLKGTCSALSNKDSAFSEDKPWLYVKYDQISSMIADELTYRVRVVQS